ncbi:hypothetical protein Rumi1_14510 [[Ruminococcus] torques]|nr:hypothetical protein Rumi1_14510 [[Ruminococcus] torques]
MTGCKGYGLRGSDATTEIERTKEADTPGEIPGRSGLQADRRTETSLSCGAHGSRSKEMEEYHYETEHERKEDSLRLRLSQPPQYGDTAEMADGPDG